MASFTADGNTLELLTNDRGESVVGAISGTYVMVIKFQIELGSLGSGAWQTLQTFNTTDGTEAFTYVTVGYSENLRLIVDEDTSGTATVTLTNTSDLVKRVVTDGRGNTLWSYRQSGVEQNAGYLKTSGTIVTLSAATLTLAPELHAGRIVVTALAATLTITLPLATGTGNVYTIYTSITATGDHIYAAAGSDVLNGVVGVSTDIAGVMESAQVTDSTLTMNGTTSGGLAGSCIVFTDVATAVWMVGGSSVSSGSESTLFS